MNKKPGVRRVSMVLGIVAVLILIAVFVFVSTAKTTRPASQVASPTATATETVVPTATIPVATVPSSLVEAAQSEPTKRKWEPCPTRYEVNSATEKASDILKEKIGVIIATASSNGIKLTIEPIGKDPDICLFKVVSNNGAFNLKVTSPKWQTDVRFAGIPHWAAYNAPMEFQNIIAAQLRFAPGSFDIFLDPIERLALANRAGRKAGYRVYNGNLPISMTCPKDRAAVIKLLSSTSPRDEFIPAYNEWHEPQNNPKTNEVGAPWVFTAVTDTAKYVSPPRGTWVEFGNGPNDFIWGGTGSRYIKDGRFYCFLEKMPTK